MFNFMTLLPMLKDLGAVVSKLFLGLFLIKVGKDKEVLDSYKKEEKNVKKVKAISANLDSKSRTRKRKLLLDETEASNDK